ncbi:Leucine rich repeat containing protein BspA family protein [Entamoeba marina]
MNKPGQYNIDSYSMMIVSKYFLSKDDYINMICICKKYKDTLDKFRYNPISVGNLTLFKNIQTQYLYSPNDEKIPNMFKYIIFYTITLKKYERMVLDDNVRVLNIENVFSDGYTSLTVDPIVNRLGHNRYQFCTFTSFEIPTHITSIGDGCFSSCGLKELVIPESIQSIGAHCFERCYKLSSISIPDTLFHFGEYCFSFCKSLIHISIPYSISSLGLSCFEGCCSLKSIRFHSSVTEIGNNCFFECTNLKEVMVPHCKKFTTKTPYWISLLLKNQEIECPNKVFTRDDVVKYSNQIQDVQSLSDFCYSYSSITEISIPSTITSIGSFCFVGCDKLSSLTLHSSLKHIGDCCFERCSSLQSLSIKPCCDFFEGKLPYFMSTILTSTSIHLLNLVYEQEDRKRFGNKIPAGVKTIGSYCFNGTRNLKSINIPSSVTELKNNAFSSCAMLTSCTIPKSVVSIGDKCFIECRSLKKLSFSKTIQIFGNGCFASCNKLKKKGYNFPEQCWES